MIAHWVRIEDSRFVRDTESFCSFKPLQIRIALLNNQPTFSKGTPWIILLIDTIYASIAHRSIIDIITIQYMLWYYIICYDIILYYISFYSITLYFITSYYNITYCILLCYILLNYAIFYYIILYIIGYYIIL